MVLVVVGISWRSLVVVDLFIPVLLSPPCEKVVTQEADQTLYLEITCRANLRNLAVRGLRNIVVLKHEDIALCASSVALSLKLGVSDCCTCINLFVVRDNSNGRAIS